jgi:hypothetical protein
MKKNLLFWIKERHNPQLGIYYIRCGQLSAMQAKRQEESLYGSNFMHGYETLDEYRLAIKDLKEKGHKVQ